jgi:hypothetical protein
MGLFGKKSEQKQKNLELDSKLFKQISRVLSAHPGEDVSTKGIAYFQSNTSEKQYLEIVGESFCQDDIRENFKPERWAYGLLVPEQTNASDPNAVAIYLITENYGVVRVGYLKKELAKKVSRKVANLMANEGLVVPVLAIVKQREDSRNLAVVAYAMTDYVKFS